jgi:hypothetical protein
LSVCDPKLWQLAPRVLSGWPWRALHAPVHSHGQRVPHRRARTSGLESDGSRLRSADDLLLCSSDSGSISVEVSVMNNASPNRRKEHKRAEKTLDRRGSSEPPGTEVVQRIWNAPGQFPIIFAELRNGEVWNCGAWMRGADLTTGGPAKASVAPAGSSKSLLCNGFSARKEKRRSGTQLAKSKPEGSRLARVRRREAGEAPGPSPRGFRSF